MLNASQFTHHLFGRCRHQTFHLGDVGAGKRNKHVGKGDINLRFFFLWCNDHRKQTQ